MNDDLCFSTNGQTRTEMREWAEKAKMKGSKRESVASSVQHSQITCPSAILLCLRHSHSCPCENMQWTRMSLSGDQHTASKWILRPGRQAQIQQSFRLPHQQIVFFLPYPDGLASTAFCSDEERHFVVLTIAVPEHSVPLHPFLHFPVNRSVCLGIEGYRRVHSVCKHCN